MDDIYLTKRYRNDLDYSKICLRVDNTLSTVAMKLKNLINANTLHFCLEKALLVTPNKIEIMIIPELSCFQKGLKTFERVHTQFYLSTFFFNTFP